MRTLALAVVAPLALARSRAARQSSAASDLGLVALLALVGAAWFVVCDDAHALAVSVALWRLGWAGWRGR